MSQEETDHPSRDQLDTSNDDETSSASSDSNDGEQGVSQLRDQVGFVPSYENYEKYVVAIRSKMMVEELRQARQAMASQYPLDPSLWIHWIDDEVRLGGKVDDVIGLFERAVKDFLSIDIWLRYAEYFSNAVQDSEQVRLLFERGIATCGAHYTEGFAFWDLYRKFEQDPQRKKRLFVRQFGVPFLQMDAVIEEYNQWHQSTFKIPAPKVASFDKAHLIYQRLLPFEANLLKVEKPSLSQFWTSYINSELSENHVHVNRITTLFERAIVALFNSELLWQKYVRFLRMNHPRHDQKPIVVEACRRAVRNCPWSVSLWGEFIISASAHDFTLENANAVFEEALSQTFQTSDDYISLVLEMCYAHIRIFSADSDVDRIRAVFKRALEFDQYTPDAQSLSNSIFSLHRYWADVELHVFNSPENARDCWSVVLKRAGKLVDVWLQYFQFEQEIGELEKCRSAFRRGLHIFQHDGGLEMIATAWVRFEAEHGSLESRDEASFKTSLLLENKRLKLQAEECVLPKSASKRKLDSKSSSVNGRSDVKKSKREAADNFAEFPKPATSKAEARFTAFVLNVDHKVSEHELEQLFSSCGQVAEVRIPRDARGRARGFAYVDYSVLESVHAAIKALDRTELRGRFISVEVFKDDATRKAPRKNLGIDFQDSGSESGVVFVKGIDKECTQARTESMLRERFAKYGAISNVRVPTTSKSSRLKGIAYIEFESDKYASAALVEDGFNMNGCNVLVAISNPPGKQQKEMSGKRLSRNLAFQPRGFAIPQAPVDRFRKPTLNVVRAKQGDQTQGTEPMGKSNSDFRSMLLNKEQ